MTKQLAEFEKTSVPTKISYGIGAFGGNIVNILGAQFLLAYYTDTALIGVAAISTMLFLTSIFDGFTDILMGAVIDKTNTRWGKCRPWLLLSSPLMVLGIIFVYNVPLGIPETGRLMYAYISNAFLVCIAVTMNNISNTSLLARLTLNMNDRTTIVSVQGLFNNSAFIIGVMVVPIVSAIGWSGGSVVFGVLAGVLIMVCFLGTKEKVGVDAETGKLKHKEPPIRQAVSAVLKNKYFWVLLSMAVTTLIINASASSAVIYYVNVIIGDPGFMSVMIGVGQLPGLFMVILMPFIAPKISKRWFMALGCIIMIIGFFIISIANGNKIIALAGMAIRMFGLGPLFAGMFALIADIIDYGEWKTGMRTEGLMSAASSMGTKIGIGIGAGMTGWVLAVGGYVGGAMEQTASAKFAINFACGWLGCILSVVLLILILVLNVEKYMPQVREALEKKYGDEGK
jgi:GPH family glycoside/pentoside/hexuronide:cation symporter